MEVESISIISIIVMAVFTHNFVLQRFLGLCPYLGVSKQLDSALGMGMAVIFVMTIASSVTWFIYYYFLNPEFSGNLIKKLFHCTAPDLRFLQTIAFILVIAALVQFVEMVIQKTSPGLYRSLGIYLPLITTNCAVLGVSLLNIREDYSFNFLKSVINGFMSGVGFTLALVLMAGLRERLELADVPKAMRGAPIAFIMAACMALAFLGFTGLKIG